ncbi:hypothetical protein A2422_02275 [Candidatus Woesebacteria bacterium RIFOXYC1_FULL_31_51]|uniref:Glycosyltransferase 2-like domain-containing protein n=1 Tax=Candidatus Woesebacteria bacterium GW2011_GWC2_31_9 TaxID=1618586 RepID=A0A0G0AXQ9_9BACT|nr:MAG: hypothetical protein UR17_C0001G0914 [Candidatus Woesebacteria bacterium GW2011_GWF1_31_35]KKP23543.1 MAG: hypothetical protein UR11_C0001G0517 [Candidatus Woesebacteria bacterium GW2011_GWC1_30_29]KKP25721.1 MAG: hypothetical protein UR13_C0007G0042 [Candidatus Woesebacteria bacterium GW2011_GWD1_31_12]KKP27819.1 MAG: hypothetical protein UR16_C0002G0149 [Candidatus Woesebacteria bacterium GW2011_GWB1_31_29]KKP31345.1 MAG: hypothetical protein UR21_C0011G0026 [Candidatus Woesebacteria 
MKISIIIPTYNEEEVILTCLESLSKQTIKDFEVIIVDDGSTDLTIQKIKSSSLERYFPLKILSQKHLGAGAGRNLGAKQSKEDILVFVDADMTFDRNFLKMLTKPIISGKTKGTFSKNEYVANWNNIWARCWNINEGWKEKMRHPNNYPDKQKVFRAILRSEFNKVGGFTPGGYNDDWSLSEKLGYESDVATNAIFYHKNPESLKEVFKSAKWVGKRPYKFRILGTIFALIRSSFPTSILVGLFKAVISGQFGFILFKIVYDLGIFIGILNYLFFKKGSK